MTSPAQRGRVYRFGVFEVIVESRELLRHGRRIKLQDQPFELLVLLLEHAGKIVDREFIRLRLWPDNTFVDYGQSLSTAITKLRQAFGDDANNPRFIETVPRRGYRFIAPVVHLDEVDGAAGLEQNSRQQEASHAESNISFGSPSRGRNLFVFFALLSVLAAVGIAVYTHHRKVFVLASGDTIVLADFENTTGDPIFDQTLRQALLVGLAQSPIIHVLPDRDSAIVLKQMGRQPDDRVTGATALDLCKRIGGKVAVQGSISSLGTSYLVGLGAIRCDNGKPIAHEEVEASQKGEVIDALGKATANLRARLGESLPSIQKYNAPLEQATTSSLDALSAFGTALSTWDEKGDLASVPRFKRAIEIDPNFAMAYGGLAAVYYNLNQAELARQYSVKAFSLKDRVTESEKASIEARYYLYVTDEVDKAAQTYRQLAQDYPGSANSFNHLGSTDQRLGLNEQAVDDFKKAIAIDPGRATSYANLALSLLRLNRIPEAESVLDQAEKRGLRTDFGLQVRYWIGFLNNNQKEMDSAVSQSSEISGTRLLLQIESANTEAYRGHFAKALVLSQSAAQQMAQSGDKESAANCMAQVALREAEVGSTHLARSTIGKARLLSDDRETIGSAALVYAMVEDFEQARQLSEKLDKAYPNGTFVQGFWLPMIRAEIDIRQGKGQEAVNLLDRAKRLTPAISHGCGMSSISPEYILGQAYLAAGDGRRADDAFGRLIEDRGLLLNSPFGALAYLGRARAISMAGDRAKARKAYNDFFSLWRDGDRDIPLLGKAKAEADRLIAAR